MEDGNKHDESTDQVGIVRREDNPSTTSASQYLAIGLVWCIAGGFSCVFATFLGAAMVGYGSVILARDNSLRMWGLAALASLASTVIVAAFFSATGIAMSVVECLVGLGLALIVSKDRVSVTSECVAIVLAAAGFLACDAYLAYMSGTSVTATISQMADLAIEQYRTQVMMDDASIRLIKSVLDVIWPISYLVLGACSVLGAHGGARVASARVGKLPARPFSLANFDVPVWTVAAVIVALACLGASRIVPAYGDIVFAVGVNVLLALRPIFAIQGFGVVTSLLGRFRIGCLGRFLVLFLAADLEVSFMVVSIFGLVDFWANFRGLPRGETPSSDGATE